MKGLYQQMLDSNKVQYTKLTSEDIHDIIHRASPLPIRTYTLQTGRMGMLHYNLTLSLSQYNIRWWTYTPKLVSDLIEISLYQKHSLYKIRYRYNNNCYPYECMYGTHVIGKATTIRSCFNLITNHNEQEFSRISTT